ncbi:hypothetical protein CBM2629_A60025 [Cupriavidus taiwanensis]|nr:hypothetical protein CBM2629_A60025 [Cupriavidus taiwanensis]
MISAKTKKSTHHFQEYFALTVGWNEISCTYLLACVHKSYATRKLTGDGEMYSKNKGLGFKWV